MNAVSNSQVSESNLSNDLTNAEAAFERLLATDDLDDAVRARPSISQDFENALSSALEFAYVNNCQQSHLFLQRVLYRINRLKFFWYDGLSNYKNEESDYLRQIQRRIESTWERWERQQLPASSDPDEQLIAERLRKRAAADLRPPVSSEGRYLRDVMGNAGYRRLLEIASLDALVEASQLSRTLGGVANNIHAMMTRLLVEEYGGGRLSRKHSSFFNVMLTELGIDATPEAHFKVVPWEVLATINHSFLLSERKSFYLRYVGGLLYTETSVPAAFENYRAAAQRLGMSEKARAYWDLHIKEDARHGRWMLDDIALPLAEMYPRNAEEIVLGYDQQRFMSNRAGRATTQAVMNADKAATGAAYAAANDLEAAA